MHSLTAMRNEYRHKMDLCAEVYVAFVERGTNVDKINHVVKEHNKYKALLDMLVTTQRRLRERSY